MSSDMPIRRPKTRGWGTPSTAEPATEATPAVAEPAALAADASSPARDPEPPPAPRRRASSAPAGAATPSPNRPEPSRPITLRLRASTEVQLDELLAPLAARGVDRTEVIHALIEAADQETAKAAVQARRRRLSDLL